MSFIAASRWSPSAGCAARALYGWEVQLRADGFLKFGQRFIFREAALKLACELPGPSARRMDGAVRALTRAPASGDPSDSLTQCGQEPICRAWLHEHTGQFGSRRLGAGVRAVIRGDDDDWDARGEWVPA